jgi:hypothetical protein
MTANSNASTLETFGISEALYTGKNGESDNP